jgi:hypothetical protein
MTDKIISQATLKQILSYDAKTGVFTWLKSGKVAGSLLPHGYLRITIQSKGYYAHRLAWLYCHGKWPAKNIDHINQQKNDNRIANLRDVGQSQNGHNQNVRRNNTSGCKGVSFDTKSKKWAAYMMLNRKKLSLGFHSSLALAVTARKQAEQKYLMIKDAV